MKSDKGNKTIIAVLVIAVIILGITSVILFVMLSNSKSDKNVSDSEPKMQETEQTAASINFTDDDVSKTNESDGIIHDNVDKDDITNTSTDKPNVLPDGQKIDIEGSEMYFLYKMIDGSDTEKYIDDSLVLGSLDNSYLYFVMSFSDSIASLALCDLGADVNDNGDLAVYETGDADIINDIKAGKNLLVCTKDVGETLPLVGIRITDNNGNQYKYHIGISGMDGSAIFTRY